MPGFVGIVSRRPSDECKRLVESMASTMMHERFYLRGYHSAPELGVYASWVALERSAGSCQPMVNECGDITLLFSGECFSEPDLLKELVHRGHQVGTGQMDWLVHAYEEQGDRFIERLNGTFSGLLIDRRTNRAFLFNDRFGFDRVYFHEWADALLFATEAKALLRIEPKLRRFDDTGIVEWMAVGATLGDRTLFEGVRRLSPASVWTIASARIAERRIYFAPNEWEAQPTAPPAEFERLYSESFPRAVARCAAAEARVGIALTAGLDSRMLMAALPNSFSDGVCYTFAGQDGLTLDASLAQRVAQVGEFRHEIIRVGADFFNEFGAYADRTVYLTDGYLGVWGSHEVYLNQLARRLAPIRLTGVFGGEIFREVCTFKPVDLDRRLLVPEARRATAHCAASFVSCQRHPVTFAAFHEIPENIFGSLAACRSQVVFRSPYLDNELVALAYRAVTPGCRSSTFASKFIRTTRPLLGQISTDMGFLGAAGPLVRIIRRLIARATFKLDYLCNDGMPHGLTWLDPMFDHLNSKGQLVGRHKYLRYRRWFRTRLAGFVRERLSEPTLLRTPWWNSAFVKTLADLHIRGRANLLREINAVLTLESIQRQMFA